MNGQSKAPSRIEQISFENLKDPKAIKEPNYIALFKSAVKIRKKRAKVGGRGRRIGSLSANLNSTYCSIV